MTLDLTITTDTVVSLVVLGAIITIYLYMMVWFVSYAYYSARRSVFLKAIDPVKQAK